MDSSTNMQEPMFFKRNYLLFNNPIVKESELNSILCPASILQKNDVLSWQSGFFPKEENEVLHGLFHPLNNQSAKDLLPGSKDILCSGLILQNNDVQQLTYSGISAANTPSTSNQLSQAQDMFITGTTTLGFKYPQGIILATDSRATARNLIVSQKLNKVIAVSERILCTLAGNAGDCVYWLHSLAKECKIFESKHHMHMSVKYAANLLANMVRKYRCGNQPAANVNGLSFGTLMASYDDALGPQLYMLDNTGLLLEGSKFCVGSGAEYAQAILDTDYKSDLSEQDAYHLATQAIFYACRRDIHSGGVVRLYKISSDGWCEVCSQDVTDIYESNVGIVGVGSGDS